MSRAYTKGLAVELNDDNQTPENKMNISNNVIVLTSSSVEFAQFQTVYLLCNCSFNSFHYKFRFSNNSIWHHSFPAEMKWQLHFPWSCFLNSALNHLGNKSFFSLPLPKKTSTLTVHYRIFVLVNCRFTQWPLDDLICNTTDRIQGQR